VQGIGGAMISRSLAIITTYFDPDQRGGAIGMWSAATTIVTVVGPVGGLLADAGASLPDQPAVAGYAVDTLLQGSESRAEEVSDKSTTPVRSCDAHSLTYGFISA